METKKETDKILTNSHSLSTPCSKKPSPQNFGWQ